MGRNGDGPDERDAFERAVRGARRLDDDSVEPTGRRPSARSRVEHDSSGSGPLLRLEQDGDRIRGAAAGVNDALLLELGRGDIEPGARLELHGLREPVARDRVLAFLAAQSEAGQRCVQIIHGRGSHSPEGVGVLREALPSWLETAAGRDQVLAYASAPPPLGGTGATLVLLRRSRSR